MNLHISKWAPTLGIGVRWTRESSESDCRGQNPLDWKILHIIGNILKIRCLRWARMTHLDTWNRSYGQKKGWESNCQFDSRPLKVGNHPISSHESGMQYTVGKISMRATTLLQTSSQSEVCMQSYRPPKVARVQIVGISGLPFGILGQNDIWVLVPWPSTKYTIRGKVVASPKFGLWWILWVYVCSWFVRAPKCCNYTLTNLLFGLCRSVWVNEVLVNLPSPMSKLQHAPLPPKCYEPKNAPNSFSFHCLHLWTCNWTHQGAWGCIMLYNSTQHISTLIK
jgi:hypothetical protein